MNPLRRPSLRLGGDAAVIVLAAVIAGGLEMGAWAIAAVVAAAWAVMAIEYSAPHERPLREHAEPDGRS